MTKVELTSIACQLDSRIAMNGKHGADIRKQKDEHREIYEKRGFFPPPTEGLDEQLSAYVKEQTQCIDQAAKLSRILERKFKLQFKSASC